MKISVIGIQPLIDSPAVPDIKSTYHQLNDEMQKFIVQKGSISINGISLTIAKVLSKSFYISIIPHTYDNTNLNKLKLNDSVNIEFDALARYIYNNEKS